MIGGGTGHPGPPRSPRYGLVVPTTEIGERRQDLDVLVRTAASVGLDYLTIYDHVVGADVSHHPGWRGPYTAEHPFHEPLTTLAYLAARTDLELMTGVLVLPQRQAVLVAKQAAQLALLTEGRFILGVGTGWNELEYRALAVDFASRGRRFDEQLQVLERLWAEPVVSFAGEHHDLEGVGMAPRPPGGRIPLWLGSGTSGPGLRRVGRVADGWIAMHPPGPAIAGGMEQIARIAVDAGRDPARIGLQGMVQLGRRAAVSALVDAAHEWRRLGATRISFSGLRAGRGPQEHRSFVETLGEVIAELRACPL